MVRSAGGIATRSSSGIECRERSWWLVVAVVGGGCWLVVVAVVGDDGGWMLVGVGCW